ncbi:MAG: hypothetical protein IT264_11305 [Saprospiraceae bacterium]|nr:hypothetical protein [Saprospiraceae bacterium]
MKSKILIKTLPEGNYNKVLKQGNIFLTRIGFYRETNNPKIKDKLEGTRGHEFRAKEIIRFPNSDLPDFGNIEIVGGYTEIHPGSNVNMKEILPDILVYCVSEKVQPNFGNRSFEIIDAIGFGEIIKKELRKEFGTKFLRGELKKVEYGGHKDKIVNMDDFKKATSSFYKELNDLYTLNPSMFALECEWRYIFFFEPGTEIGKVGFGVYNLEIHKYCKF